MRLIDADRLVPKLKKVHIMSNPRLREGRAVRELILNIINYFEDEKSQIDPESLRPKARWLKISVPFNTGNECSNCGWGYSDSKGFPDFKFCPNCGAKMDLEVR